MSTIQTPAHVQIVEMVEPNGLESEQITSMEELAPNFDNKVRENLRNSFSMETDECDRFHEGGSQTGKG